MSACGAARSTARSARFCASFKPSLAFAPWKVTSSRPATSAGARASRARTLREEAAAGKLALDAADVLIAARTAAPWRAPELAPRAQRARPRCCAAWPAAESNAEAAQLLGISPSTVKNHLANVYAKLGAHSRAGAALFAAEHGLLR